MNLSTRTAGREHRWTAAKGTCSYTPARDRSLPFLFGDDRAGATLAFTVPAKRSREAKVAGWMLHGLCLRHASNRHERRLPVFNAVHGSLQLALDPIAVAFEGAPDILARDNATAMLFVIVYFEAVLGPFRS